MANSNISPFLQEAYFTHRTWVQIHYQVSLSALCRREKPFPKGGSLLILGL
jgi:hypothetical protein